MLFILGCIIGFLTSLVVLNFYYKVQCRLFLNEVVKGYRNALSIIERRNVE